MSERTRSNRKRTKPGARSRPPGGALAARLWGFRLKRGINPDAATHQTPPVPRALTAPPDDGPSRVLPLALLTALFLHLFLLLGVSFQMPQPDTQAPADETLEILILKDAGQTTATPEPDAALSQRSRVGESPQADSVVSADADPDAEVEVMDEEVVEPEPPAPLPPPPPPARTQPPEVLTAAPEPKPEHQVKPPVDPLNDPLSDPGRPVDAAQILASRNQEIARLTESLEARGSAYASRQRHKSISASTREYRYANYLAAWARKVEQIGNLNYPQAAKDRRLHGSLILHVGVRADGTVEKIRIVRSSGHELLDQAAIKIVQLAAPYAPFPPDIAAETDVLDIIRTWQFLRGGKLGWE
ncbi:energy transducer TonB [uncultured Lamprocystis sp.]|uniref:energy transducer TonB n=1 Tax=uncultured Lamprocystis sp. TaxID=543132 RepID=UPI0025EA0FA9|nr:energy transducer TonB [uncultured Lamprocystis sp.]